MSPDLDRRLCEEFPSLYRDRRASMRETAMCWGFECGDGWFTILRELSLRLEPLGVVAGQVKEKYGVLRFYGEGDGGEEAERAIEEAERRSAETCEECGRPGALVARRGWYSTFCEAHQ